MPQTLTINLVRPITALHVLDAEDHEAAVEEVIASCAPGRDARWSTEAQERKLKQLSETLNNVVARLNEFYLETVAKSRSDIARLAVEIARKILMWKTEKGDYDIHAIVEETLKRAPTRQNIVIRLNPEDLPLCQQAQQDNPESPLAELEFVGDWGIARANCLIETPKGIVKSFVDECLERIAQALEKTQ